MNLGKVFKTERERLGVSRTEMAKRLGLTVSALWKIEAGKTQPKSGTIKKFCDDALIPLAYFYSCAMEREDYIAHDII